MSGIQFAPHHVHSLAGHRLTSAPDRGQLCLAWGGLGRGRAAGRVTWQLQTGSWLLVSYPLLSPPRYRCLGFFYASFQAKSSPPPRKSLCVIPWLLLNLAERSSSSLTVRGFWTDILSDSFRYPIHTQCLHVHGCFSSWFLSTPFCWGDVWIPLC